MTTELQVDANRENALKSTGPTTIEGKTRSSRNAMKHGLLSKDLVIHGERVSEYQVFRKSLIDNLQPEGPIELLLVEKMSSCAWRQRRAIQAESALFHKQLSSRHSCKNVEHLFTGPDGNCLQNITRYEAATEKNFYRALHQLKELQKARKDSSWDLLPNGFVS